jgi:Bax protein
MKKPKRSALVRLSYAVIIFLSLIYYASRDKESVDFSSYPAGQERKEAFIGHFLPIIQAENRDILKLRERLTALSKSSEPSSSDESLLTELAERYKLKPDDPALVSKLLTRVDIIPPSLALSQSANESAWGTSRFAVTANNYFGQWCFTEGCGVVPKQRNKGAVHEVKTFDSASQSVTSYIHNLNTNSAYQRLRAIRKNLRKSGREVTGHALAAGLIKYSERGHEYVDELRNMIRQNKFAKLDMTGL